MDQEPKPCLDFASQHLLGLSLVGSVPLPSPFPASARAFVIRYPAAPDAKGEAAGARLFLKLVENINHHHLITRIVDPANVSAIRWSAAKVPAGQPCESVLQSGDQLREEIAKIDWSKAVKDPASSYEVSIHPDETAVAFVKESAPVLLRHEQTLPAAVSVAASPAMMAAACPHGDGKR